ncbi:hypothetical protein BURMUCF1_2922 [Burkholderia multivorans ATCC BAA-247]|jgi:hypothetical protein|uniref:Uncharacterized protein n=1 Tax=Burkholderia multivorans CGD2 TaxID=513052 RepID=B9BVP4_9BURK|nr:hypothetical protein BURMUCGD2_0556 [Burkholderia multivorans CGD2]EEE12549.1 hypothetical protein BURMUCGD2M_0645 [Burkholderia multivorans CGD2M]EJO55715.1 hypothetical protein BURMUCF1_2922 [Burkholderia multivorans ATCC BAA-247]
MNRRIRPDRRTDAFRISGIPDSARRARSGKLNENNGLQACESLASTLQ